MENFKKLTAYDHSKRCISSDTSVPVVEGNYKITTKNQKYMKKLWDRIQKSFAIHIVSKRNDDYKTTELRRKLDSLKFWTPELIEWIGKENDPVKLAVASCLVNCNEWPEWLPGKPKENKDREYLFYTTEVYEILKRKSEKIAPKLYSYIWLTNYYHNYAC